MIEQLIKEGAFSFLEVNINLWAESIPYEA